MTKVIRNATLAALTLACASTASASVYSDDLGKCLVKETTDTDKHSLIQWIFSAVAAGPVVKSMSAITPAQRRAFNQQAAAMVERLLTANCRAESVRAIKYDGGQAIENSFSMLGEVAMRGMMSDPAVVAALEDYAGYIDMTKMQTLFEEAGVPAKKSTPPAK